MRSLAVQSTMTACGRCSARTCAAKASEIGGDGVRELLSRLPQAHRARVGDGAHAQIDVELLLEDRRLRLELSKERLAHEPGPHDAD